MRNPLIKLSQIYQTLYTFLYDISQGNDGDDPTIIYARSLDFTLDMDDEPNPIAKLAYQIYVQYFDDVLTRKRSSFHARIRLTSILTLLVIGNTEDQTIEYKIHKKERHNTTAQRVKNKEEAL